MTILQALILGLIQGATEFIPVSSSGHLTLVPWLLDWQFEPVLKGAFDVLTHWGTLVAVVAVFWRDLWALLLGGLRTLGGVSEGGVRGVLARIETDTEGRLAWLIVVGSIPAAVLGVLLEDFFEMLFGTPRIVSLLLLVTAVLLALSEWRGQKGREVAQLTWIDALLIGLGQALAIAPGISRSGSTIASGLLRGVKRDAAARFSFLLSTPVIVGAGVWQLRDLFESGDWTAHLGPMLVGFLASAIVGYLCIRFLLGFLRKGKLYSFAIYCTVAGMACLVVSFFQMGK
jgi:undecaprenyl-diphosphatase